MYNSSSRPNPAEQYPDLELLTGTEVAKLLKISDRKLWELTNDGWIPAVKMRKSVRYRPEDVRRYIQGCLDAQRADVQQKILDTKTSTG